MNKVFEWDDVKAASNKLKHGITFDEAALVFDDDNRLEIYDELHSTIYEDRYQIIGWVHDVLFVVVTERTDVTRIISARKATPKERRRYYDYDS